MRIYIGEIPVDLLTIDEILTRIQDIISRYKNFNNILNKLRNPVWNPELVRGILQGVELHQIVTLNSLMYNFTFKDTEFRKALQNATLVIPDSAGIVIASWILVNKKHHRVRRIRRIPGIDLMLRICKVAEDKNYKIFLLGAKEEIIHLTVSNLKKIFPKLNIVGYHHGYFRQDDEEKIIEEIHEAAPDVVFIGLDIPRQEKWIYRNRNRLKAAIVMGVGGSFDIISGKLRRAPKWIRIMCLEWLFRLLQEPWRIKRIINLPAFVYRIVFIKFKQRKTD